MSDAPVTILYFAWLRERIGTAAEELMLPPEVETVANLVDFLAMRGAGYATAFANRRAVRCAINQEFAPTSAPVHGGDEVAFFPPVTGG
jgi:sulfur-carrier protein